MTDSEEAWTSCRLRLACLYLSCEDATEADDDQDIKDSWSHNSPHAHVSLCDKHPYKEQSKQRGKKIREISL